jgi:hypothetical protein
MPDSSLIGEHINYALFGVFPSAINRDILVACTPLDSSRKPDAIRGIHYPPQFICKAFVDTKLSENEADIKEIGKWHLGIDKKVLHWESNSMLCQSRISCAYSSSGIPPKVVLSMKPV